MYSTAAIADAKLRAGEKVSVEIVAKELRRQINIEAKLSGKEKPDYKAVFDLFDDNGNGSIDLQELKAALIKYQLISTLADSQIPTLLSMFDKHKRGVIQLDDFIEFARGPEKERKEYITYVEVADDKKSNYDEFGNNTEIEYEDDDIESMTTNIPPVAITRNETCDWLLWHLYRQCYRLEPTDPESVVTELESQCAQARITRDKSIKHISIKDIWNILFELKMQGTVAKEQFIKGTQYLSNRGIGKEDDKVDYELLCKLIVRMGRAFNALVQEKVKHDEAIFEKLIGDLKRYFKELNKQRS